jgi:Uma2 family endonuclease
MGTVPDLEDRAMGPTALADRLITADEFMTMPEPPNAQFDELVRGRVVLRPAHSFMHGICRANVAGTFGSLLRGHRRGYAVLGTGVVTETNPDTVRGPDFSFLSFERHPGPLNDDWFRVPPDLIAEVIEPNERGSAIDEKVREYLAFGCRMVWTIDPELRSVIVHRPDRADVLGPGATLEFDEVLPGGSIAVADLLDMHDS